ncbi:SLAC1 anion channel family protein [Flavobacterium sp. 3-210]
MENLKKISFLEFLPVSFFGGVMGLCGLCFSWRLASKMWDLPSWISEIIGAMAVMAFIILTILYLLKLNRYPDIVKQEFFHPVSVSLFGTFIISLLLLPGIILPYNVPIAVALWSIGTLLMLYFSLMVLRKLIDNQQDAANGLPVWIIPVVGTLDVPIIGLKLPVEAFHEVCGFFFGVGIIFSIILITIIISRLIFQPQLSKETQPTLLILVGPFALAFSGYLGLNNVLDITAKVFFYFDLFIFALLFSKILLLPNCCPFRVSWWSVSFPLVAITIASLNFAKIINQSAFEIIAVALLTISSIIISYLFIQTMSRIIKGDFLLHNVSAEKATSILQGRGSQDAFQNKN